VCVEHSLFESSIPLQLLTCVCESSYVRAEHCSCLIRSQTVVTRCRVMPTITLAQPLSCCKDSLLQPQLPDLPLQLPYLNSR
jgi:hypothetical protein